MVKNPLLHFVLSMALLHSCTKNLEPAIQTADKNQLIQDIREIGRQDQQYRNTATELRAKNKGIRTEEEGRLWAQQSLLDSINMIRVEAIIARYGYPGANIVGDDLKSVAALVILHNPKKQEKYLSLLWREAKKGNADKREVAILEDRIKMMKGQKQKYGTAMKYEPVGFDSVSGKEITRLRIWEIEQFKHLDKIREKVGLYSFKLQCELEGIDWTQFKNYVPKKTQYDFEFK